MLAFVILQKDLANTKQQLEDLNAQLSSLRSQFEEKTAEQQELKAKADIMERRLVAASRLIAGLGSERTRWSADIEELERRKVGNLWQVLASVQVVCCGQGRAEDVQVCRDLWQACACMQFVSCGQVKCVDSIACFCESCS